MRLLRPTPLPSDSFLPERKGFRARRDDAPPGTTFRSFDPWASNGCRFESRTGGDRSGCLGSITPGPARISLRSVCGTVNTLDAFIVMPNHVHGMVILNGTTDPEGVGAQHAAPLHTGARRSAAIRDSVRVVPGSLGAIVRSFKSATAKRINEARNTPAATVWQRNYYDRVIRDDRELHRARRYILSNPDRWSEAGKD